MSYNKKIELSQYIASLACCNAVIQIVSESLQIDHISEYIMINGTFGIKSPKALIFTTIKYFFDSKWSKIVVAEHFLLL